jgi:4-hydroxybenzoate polyprenyltransferase
MAMHAYSAIPDIDADKKAWLHTTAVLLGEKMTIWYCVVLYALAWLLTAISFWRWFLVIWIWYGLYILVAYLTKNIFWFYRFFPYINWIVWLWLFWWVVFFL